MDEMEYRDLLIYGVSISKDGKRIDPTKIFIKLTIWERILRWLSQLTRFLRALRS